MLSSNHLIQFKYSEFSYHYNLRTRFYYIFLKNFKLNIIFFI